jgi:hypothetical protein
MKKFIAISAFVLLSGCGTTEQLKLIAPEYKIVKPPEEMYNCPVVTKFPKTDKMTNEQVGTLLLNTQQNNITCKNSLDNIKKYMNQAEEAIQKK